MSDNLPPGCTDKDIERHFGDIPTKQCEVCDYDFEPDSNEQTKCEHCLTHSPCCDVKFDTDIRICPKCGENV